MGSFNDLSGKSYHRLMAFERVANEGGHTMWRSLCDCGNFVIVRAQHLRNGNTKSCGCWDADVLAARSTIHGQSYAPVYESWKGMIQRCTNPANREWHNYGGRGIQVCSEWLTFANFYRDMGDRPKNKTLDRKDVDGNYELLNCRWATSKEQAANTRKKKLTANMKSPP